MIKMIIFNGKNYLNSHNKLFINLIFILLVILSSTFYVKISYSSYNKIVCNHQKSNSTINYLEIKNYSSIYDNAIGLLDRKICIEYNNKYFEPEVIVKGIWLAYTPYGHIPGYYLAYWKVWSNIEQDITVIVGLKNATTGEILYSVKGTVHIGEGYTSNFTWFYIDKEGEMIPFLNITGFKNDTYLDNNYVEGSNLTFIKPINIGLSLVAEVYDWGNDKFVFYPNKTIFLIHIILSSDTNKTGLNIPVNVTISYYDLLHGREVVIPYNFVVNKVIDGIQRFNFTFKAPYTRFINIYGKVKWLKDYGDDPADNSRNITIKVDHNIILLEYSKPPAIAKEGEEICIRAKYWNNLVDVPKSSLVLGVHTIIDNKMTEYTEYEIKPGITYVTLKVKLPENPTRSIIPYIWSVKQQSILRNVTIDVSGVDSYGGDEDITFKIRVLSNENINNLPISLIFSIIILLIIILIIVILILIKLIKIKKYYFI